MAGRIVGDKGRARVIKPSNSGTGLRPRHGAALVVATVVAVIVAYAAFGFIVGVIAFFVKLVVVVAVITLIGRLLFRHASR